MPNAEAEYTLTVINVAIVIHLSHFTLISRCEVSVSHSLLVKDEWRPSNPSPSNSSDPSPFCRYRGAVSQELHVHDSVHNKITIKEQNRSPERLPMVVIGDSCRIAASSRYFAVTGVITVFVDRQEDATRQALLVVLSLF